ncbi:MFS transporter [Paenibacillus thermotolerans]|uniref:MFS transporter n=1 Tax=Paenibacillus thermotolerans TaxID=3027807 RepID=UPI0023689E34|nr:MULTISPECIES: MFS transporter [unclassified Paenibacillus]
MHSPLMKNRPYVMIWLAQIASNIGDQFYSIALLWYLLQKVDSPSSLSLLTIPEMAAGLLFYIVFGAAADRYSPRRLMIGADLARFALIAVVFFLALSDVGALGPFMAVQFGIGMFAALFFPARTVALRRVVPPEQLAQANAIQDSTFRAVRIAAPLAVGALAAFVPLHWLMLVNTISYVASAVFILAANHKAGHAARYGGANALGPVDPLGAPAIEAPRAKETVAAIARRFSEDIRSALKELLRKRSLLYTLLFGNMGFIAWQVLWTVGFPVLAAEVASGAGSSVASPGGEANGGQLGVIVGSYGVGNLIGSLLMTRIPVRTPIYFIVAGWLLLAAGYGIIAAGHASLWLVYVGSAIAGLGGPVIGIPQTTAIQTESEPENTGKIFSLNMLMFTVFCIGSAGFGALGFGNLPVSVMFWCGSAFLAVMCVSALLLYAGERKKLPAPVSDQAI